MVGSGLMLILREHLRQFCSNTRSPVNVLDFILEKGLSKELLISDATYEDMKASLLHQKECRYAACDLELEHNGQSISKLAFISWSVFLYIIFQV